jgi:ferredoxin
MTMKCEAMHGAECINCGDCVVARRAVARMTMACTKPEPSEKGEAYRKERAREAAEALETLIDWLADRIQGRIYDEET